MGSLRNVIVGRTRLHIVLAGAVVSTLAAASAAVVQLTAIERVDAVWSVDGEIGESSQRIPIRASHPTCPSWSDLGGLVVRALETDDAVTITVTFPDHDAGVVICDWIPTSMPATVKLETPLGDRQLIDGGTGSDPRAPAAIAFDRSRSAGD